MGTDAVRQLLHDDGALDEQTLRLCGRVLRRARMGHTLQELVSYLGYERSVAHTREDKERVRRVTKAIKTNRWGLRTAVEAAQAEARQRHQQQKVAAGAVWAYHDEIRRTKSLIPPNKRGRGSGGRRKRDKPASPPRLRGTIV